MPDSTGFSVICARMKNKLNLLQKELQHDYEEKKDIKTYLLNNS